MLCRIVLSCVWYRCVIDAVDVSNYLCSVAYKYIHGFVTYGNGFTACGSIGIIRYVVRATV